MDGLFGTTNQSEFASTTSKTPGSSPLDSMPLSSAENTQPSSDSPNTLDDILESRRTEVERIQERRRVEHKLKLWEQTRAPLRHRRRKWDDLIPHAGWEAAFARCAELVSGGGIVTLLGPRGTGKTQIGVELCRKLCRDDRVARYYRSVELGLRIRESYDKQGVSERDVIRDFVRPHLLVLDEIQERTASQFEQRILTLIIDLRYGHELPTVLIGNLADKAFLERVGDSIADRLQEEGEIINCEWESFRGKRQPSPGG